MNLQVRWLGNLEMMSFINDIIYKFITYLRNAYLSVTYANFSMLKQAKA